MASLTAPRLNLLSKKKLVFDEQQTLATKVKKGAGIALLVYGVILAVVVGLTIFVTQQVSQIKMAQEQVKTTLSANTVLVSQYEQVVSKVGMISDLMNARQEVVNLWQKLQTLLPEGCSLSRFSIKDNVLMVGIQAPHVVLANKALDVIEPALPSLGAEKTKLYLSRSEDASYRLDFELALKTTKKE